MKRLLSILFAIITWFAVLTQYYLMMENRNASVTETIIRFFSFFTILTNLLVAIYFTLVSLKAQHGLFALVHKPGTLTAITSYICIVGLVYQIILRHLWQPAGLQMIVDELLHTIIPVTVIVYWYLYENKSSVSYKHIPKWLIYPLTYLIYILLRGTASNFYPYPFVNLAELGLSKVILNSVLLMGLFTGLSLAFIRVGKAINK